jgi:uncharacterized protein YecE (DUF72 family)
MDFGRIPEKDLNKTDFILPPDPAFNKTVLPGKPVDKPDVYLGCSKWGIKEWIGKLYPKGTKEDTFLDQYIHHYNALELNATHYKLHPLPTFAKWAEKAKDLHFKFCPKVYKGISHFGTLDKKQEFTNIFLERAVLFGKQLGPVFLQVSDRFSPKRKDELFRYLETLPLDIQFFLEVRHPEWYNPEIQQLMFQKLKELGIGAIITDTAGRRDMVHMHLTTPKTFIRYVGNSLHPTDFVRCDEWVNRIKYWLEKGIQQVYFFMHMHDEALSPELTVYIAEKLNKECGLNLKVPVLIKEAKNKKKASVKTKKL